MSLKNDYTLDFTHPPKEVETIHYHLDRAFFESIEESVITDAEVDLELIIEPVTNLRFQFHLNYEGTVNVPCDRCLQPLSLDMEVHEGLEIILGDHIDDENDEQITLDVQDPIYDFSWIFYELLALHLPIQRTHDIEDCDPEILKYLVNEQPLDEEEDEEALVLNPMFQALKDKMDKKNSN